MFLRVLGALLNNLLCSDSLTGRPRMFIALEALLNLGVTLDQNLSFQQHVSRTCQICYFELRRINSIRHYMSQDALKTLISAFVLSRIDYCNPLLAGCPKQLIHKLQKVHNNAARLISRTAKFDHISPVLHTLHWLPVNQRIEYKLLLLAFKSVNNDGLSYLSDLLKFYIPSRQLRSSSYTRLVSGLCSMELSSDLTPSFQLYISLLIGSTDASLPLPVAFSSLHCERERGREERERVCVCVCICVCRWIHR